jgi:hypothetical protein
MPTLAVSQLYRGALEYTNNYNTMKQSTGSHGGLLNP